MTGLDLTMLPLTAVVLGLIAVVALVVTVWANWGAITSAVGSALSRFGAMVAGLAQGALGLLRTGIEWLNTHLPIVSQVLVVLVSPVLLVIDAFTHWHQIIGVVGSALETLRPVLTFFQGIMSGIGGAIKGAVTWIGQLASAVAKLASGPLATVAQMLGGIASLLSKLRLPGLPTLPTGGGGAIVPAASPALLPAPPALPFGPPAPLPFGPPAPLPPVNLTPAPGMTAAQPFGPAAPAHMHMHTTHAPTTTHHTQNHTQHVHPGAVTVNIHGAGGTPTQNADAAMAAAFGHLGAAANHELQHGTIRPHGASPRTRVPYAVP